MWPMLLAGSLFGVVVYEVFLKKPAVPATTSTPAPSVVIPGISVTPTSRVPGLPTAGFDPTAVAGDVVLADFMNGIDVSFVIVEQTSTQQAVTDDSGATIGTRTVPALSTFRLGDPSRGRVVIPIGDVKFTIRK